MTRDSSLETLKNLTLKNEDYNNKNESRTFDINFDNQKKESKNTDQERIKMQKFNKSVNKSSFMNFNHLFDQKIQENFNNNHNQNINQI